MDFFGIGPMEIILILIIGLLIFGPGKLPQIGRDLGRAFRSFKKAATDISVEISKELDEEKKDLDSLNKATSDVSVKMTKELDEIREGKDPHLKQTGNQESGTTEVVSKPEKLANKATEIHPANEQR